MIMAGIAQSTEHRSSARPDEIRGFVIDRFGAGEYAR
jgi:hypothetical protein